MVKQGDVVKFDNLAFDCVVVSNDLYNSSGNAVVCPIVKNSKSILAFPVETDVIKGYVQCDNLRMMNMNKRDYLNKGSVSVIEMINIMDIVSSIMDII